MASTNANANANANAKEIATEIPTWIRVYSDGTVERPRDFPIVPPSLEDPNTYSGVSSKDVFISHNPPKPISARIYLPNITNSDSEPHKLPIYVYFHGGGFFFESAFSKLFNHHFLKLVPQANAIVVSVEYRLAPEHPLPAAYNDCWDALKWVASHSTQNNAHTEPEPWLVHHGDFSRVFLGGDSAGANIVHNILAFRNEALPGDVKILGAILAHPYFYSSQPVGSEPVTGPGQSFFNEVWNLVYPSAPAGIDNPFINPLGPGAPSLAGLACSRILVCVAGKDLLRERGVWYYEAVKKSGWPGEIQLFEEKDEDHVYHLLKPALNQDSHHAHKLIKLMASFFLN